MSRQELAGNVGEDGSAPESVGSHIVDQRHRAYTLADHSVWQEVLARNEQLVEQHRDRMHPAYTEGLAALKLPTSIPSIAEINERLAPTGWRTVCVDGYIPTADYVGLMASNVFPVSRVIRRPMHIDYAPAPDMVHDILGHLPMLFSPEYRRFLKRLAAVMSDAVPNALDREFYEANRAMSELKSDITSPRHLVEEAEARVGRVQRALKREASELTHLSRMYLWSLEFGLLGTPGNFSIFGAALLSSPAEFRTLCDAGRRPEPYSLDVIHHDIDFSDLQASYFVAKDFAQYDEVLAEYEIGMRGKVDVRTSEIREIATGERAGRRRHA
jgi:phenylalanine-4-hydroxylase